jgi:MFS family permease
MFFFPLNLIQVQGYSATAAGAAWLPFILILFFLSRWSGGLVEKFGAKPPLVAGPLIVTLGYLLFMIPAASDNYWTSFFPGMAVLGFGMALIVAPLTTTVMNAVPGERAGVASGVNNAVSRIAGLLGIAVLGIVIVQSFNRDLDGNLNALKIAPEVRRAVDEQRVRLAGAQLSSVVDQGLRASLEQGIKESFIFGFRMVMLAAAGLALLGAVVAMTAIESRPK